MTPAAAPRVEHLTTDGVFTLDGRSFAVTNNVWLVGDSDEVVVIDPAHDAGAIAAATEGRRVATIVCTHGHSDHINAAVDVAERVGAPIALHPNDRVLWDVVHPDRAPDLDLADGQTISVGGFDLQVIHTPGHSPGSVCLVGDGVVFSGDTLFHGGPGATDRSHADVGTIIASIRDRLLVLPDDTVVRAGHGDTTTIGDEAEDLDAWTARGA